jgi:predicted GNAT family acetyltransferase
MPLPAPKRNEAYTSYVRRVFNYVKRNKTAVRGSYSGRGKNRKLVAPVVMKRIGVAWRKHTRGRK